MQYLDTIFTYLAQHYSDATTELNRETPFQLLIAVIMSAQTTDKQVNKVTNTLFQQITHPQDIIALGLDGYTQAIKSIGLYTSKAKNIYKTALLLTDPTYQQQQKTACHSPLAHELFQQYGYYLPDNITSLTTLHGVGVKTAKVVAQVLYNMPVIAVDTHVHRVANRLGLVDTKTPDQTAKVIEKVVPDHYTQVAHHGLILFGRYHCTTRKPACSTCPFTTFCPSSQTK